MRGHVRQRGDAWELRAYVGRDPVAGRKKYLIRTFRGGKRAAEEALSKFVTEVGGGAHAAQDATVSDLIEQWQAASLGFGLLLWDGYRPQRAVDYFLRWARQPEDGKTKLRHYPNIERTEMVDQGYVAAKSGHSRGSAVDLTLFQLATGSLLPMGGRHDLMDPVSHHGAKGITPVEAGNRRVLCSIMEASRFRPFNFEWWHYSLKDEPYPIGYFDFPITATAARGTRALLGV